MHSLEELSAHSKNASLKVSKKLLKILRSVALYENESSIIGEEEVKASFRSPVSMKNAVFKLEREYNE